MPHNFLSLFLNPNTLAALHRFHLT